MTILGVATTGARFGTDNAALKICGGGSLAVRRDLFHLVVTVILSSTIVAALSLGIALLLRSEQDNDFTVYLVTASAILPQALVVVLGAVMRGRQLLAVGTMAELGSISILTVLLLAPVAYLGQATLTSTIGCVAIASWVTLLWSAPVAFRVLAASDRGPRDFALVGMRSFYASWGFSLAQITGSSLLIFLVNWFPVLLLSAVGTLSEVSYFTVALRMVGFITLIPAIQTSYLAPQIGRLYQKGQLTELNEMSARAAILALAFSSMPALALILAAEPIVTMFYGGEFSASAVPVAIMAASALSVIFMGPVNAQMFLCGLEKTSLMLNAGLTAAWATLGFFLASEFGLIGAASFQAGASVLIALASVYFLNRWRKINPLARIPKFNLTPKLRGTP